MIDSARPGSIKRPQLLVAAALVVATCVAWLLTQWLAEMPHGDMSLGMIAMHGVPRQMIFPFLLMWVAMMTAMMVPVVGPTVLAHHMVMAKGDRPIASSLVFVAGYLGSWSLLGLVPLALFSSLPYLTMELGRSPLLIGGGVLLVAAGVYQFTPLKEACLRHCRHPLHFLMSHDFARGATHTFRAGMVHGGFCVGCCWGFMLILVALGMTNLILMPVLTALFVLERWWKGGPAIGRIVAPAVAAGGLWMMAAAV